MGLLTEAGGASIDLMAIFRIRHLDDSLMLQLRERAAHNNRSLEEEAKEILKTALDSEEVTKKSRAE